MSSNSRNFADANKLIGELGLRLGKASELALLSPCTNLALVKERHRITTGPK